MSAAGLGSVEIVAGFSAAMFTGSRLSGRVVQADDTVTTRLVASLVILLTQLIGVQLFCGALVLLYAPVVLTVHLAIAATVWKTVPSVRWRHPQQDGVPWPSVLLAGVLAYAGGTAVVLSARGATHETDSIAYHVPNAASWMQVHGIWHLPATNPGFFTNAYPSDGELLVTWLMQPFHGTQVSTFPNLLFGVVILAAAAMIAQQLGRPAAAGVLGAAIIMLCPMSWQTQVHTDMTDWAGLSGLLAAVALTLRGRQPGSGPWAAMIGLALGIGVGSKDTALLPGIAIVIFAIAVWPPSRRVRAVLLIAVGVVALAGIWYVRTGIATGNPIYPEPVSLLGWGGGVSPLTHYSTSLLSDIGSGSTGALHSWFHLVRTLVGLPAIVCLGVALSFGRSNRRTLVVGCGLLALAWFVLYLATPYTGPGSEAFLIGSQLRYALPAFTLASIVACVSYRWVAVVVGSIALIADVFNLLRHPTTINHDLYRSASSAAVGVVAALAVMAVLVWNKPALNAWRASTRAALLTVWAAGLIVAVGAGTALTTHRSSNPTLLTSLSDPSSRHTVMIIDARDVVAALGPHLEYRLIGPGVGSGHEIALTDPATLDRRIATSKPAAIFLGPAGPGVIPGWTPPGYRLIGMSGQDKVFAPSVPS